MAFHIEKQKTTSTPYVLIDEEKSYMKLEGRCFHEKVAEFFEEANDWLERYLASDFGVFTFDCAIDYFNSSTTKLLLNMLLKMDRHASAEKKIIVNWIASKNNGIIIECGEDFKDDMNNLEFNLVVN
ncbi:MAG: DUF1987 domain-containing protein [Candidatus Fibromonas sp.]|jgi:hypothetical protein|nr:DUF1987 domain-containing protein [Candidatus Fibromonas sp.]